MQETNWSLELLRIVPTTFISIGIGYVAFMQWKTAHTKVMIDLFDKRLAVYEAILEAITLSHSDNGNGERFKKAHAILYRARAEANFLYGEVISSQITKINDCLYNQQRLERRLREGNLLDAELEAVATDLESNQNQILDHARNFQTQCIPFLQILTKKIRTPSEWFRDMNATRLSYADEKQRSRD